MSDSTTVVAAAPEPPPAPAPRLSRPRRVVRWLREGNSVMLTVYAFLLALAVGAVLIAVTNPATIKAAKYFFQAPADTFSAAWSAVSSAYSALFEGAIWDLSLIHI